MRTLYFSFFLADKLFGVPAASVLELSRDFSITRFPGAPAWVSGLINLRGQLALAVNLKARMGLEQADATQAAARCVFLEHDGQLLALVVDRIGELFPLDDQSFVPAPVELAPETRDLVIGAYRLPQLLLHVLDTARIVPAANPLLPA